MGTHTRRSATPKREPRGASFVRFSLCGKDWCVRSRRGVQLPAALREPTTLPHEMSTVSCGSSPHADKGASTAAPFNWRGVSTLARRQSSSGVYIGTGGGCGARVS